MLVAVAAAFLNRLLHCFTNLSLCQIMARVRCARRDTIWGQPSPPSPSWAATSWDSVELMARFGSERIREHGIPGTATLGTLFPAVLFGIEPWPFARPESTAGSLGSLSSAPGLAGPLASA